MATYNKRGHKLPKPKETETEDVLDTTSQVDVQESTTAEVFETLDSTANRAEEFFQRNQKMIIGVLLAIAGLAAVYVLYSNFYLEPREEVAAEQMFTSQQNFQGALDAQGVAKDSLFNLALNGADGRLGFVKIADEYSGTKTGNLARYYAGISYLNIGKNKEAIAYLEKFNSDDILLSALAKGAIGDAFAQLNQLEEALKFYQDAAKLNENDITSPRFLYKAGTVALELDKKDVAHKAFSVIKEKYEASTEARNIEGLIEMTK